MWKRCEAVLVLCAAATTCAAQPHVLENEALRLAIRDDGRVTVLDKRAGIAWEQVLPVAETGWPKGGPVVGGPTPVTPFDRKRLVEIESVTSADGGITIHASWQVPLQIRWSLSGADAVEVVIETPDLEKELAGDTAYWGPVLAYPPPFVASEHADLAVVCEDEGALYATAETDPELDHVRFLNKPIGRGTSMPWWGVMGRGFGAGVMTVVDTPFYALQRTLFFDTPEGRRALPTVLWLRAREGGFGTARRLRFCFEQAGGYVAMAKRFRRELIDAGRFVTLDQKAAVVPALGKLKGAMDLWVFSPGKPLTAEQVAHIHGLGFEKLLLQTFSSTQPTPESAFTPDAVRKAHEVGYLIGQYHLYSWVYERQYKKDPTIKDMCIRARYGFQPTPAGMWGAYLFYCPAVLGGILAETARAEKAYGFDSLFTDTTTAGGSLQDCFHEKHPLTRGEAAAALSNSLGAVSSEGLIVGSERGFWWAAEHAHFFEGIETLIQYFHPFTGPTVPLHHAGPFRKEMKGYKRYMVDVNYGPHNRVPLFQLVFHDSVVCMRRWNDHHTRDLELWRMNDLINICYGTPPIVCFHHQAGPHIFRDDYKPHHERYLRTYRDVCGWHGQIGFDEMTNHEFLTEDRLVQRTTFSSGRGVIVNFGQTEWTAPDGRRVPATLETFFSQSSFTLSTKETL